MNYDAYITSKRWRQRRRAALEAAKWKCAGCGKPAQEVHHLTYERLGRERPEDLRALCVGCHVRVHKYAGTVLGTRTEIRDGKEYKVYEMSDAPMRGRRKQYVGGYRGRKGAKKPKQVSTRHVLASKKRGPAG